MGSTCRCTYTTLSFSSDNLTPVDVKKYLKNVLHQVAKTGLAQLLEVHRIIRMFERLDDMALRNVTFHLNITYCKLDGKLPVLTSFNLVQYDRFGNLEMSENVTFRVQSVKAADPELVRKEVLNNITAFREIQHDVVLLSRLLHDLLPVYTRLGEVAGRSLTMTPFADMSCSVTLSPTSDYLRLEVYNHGILNIAKIVLFVSRSGENVSVIDNAKVLCFDLSSRPLRHGDLLLLVCEPKCRLYVNGQELDLSIMRRGVNCKLHQYE